ncbi:MAG: phosphotransferase, partial [Candidatus Latescibacteria bacterium]|nr:phosphotransferase [Candidatus Latescibacterota bacterium]
MTRAREHLTTLEDELQYTELCPCHLDLHARNIILTPSGNTILIDWVNSGLSDPALDIATLFVFLGPAKRGSRWLS